ncbi:hypothetical protein BLA60_15630 [Actinophytocola xinjiangensis]|uniref:DUF4878 domain-containing protein n=1 Tax=Actinophytocola xinjiangensis TaxID=485602 RepID=A0A7Z0WNU5_9PSEU|nr:hypothetical protein [Actinophytocola xinjiangensis]OLF10604.1 hypothetical protein BLA60_15630 [Actinophytocola xinjiangensis]
MAIVLGAVVVLGVTGFVAPGFFLSAGHTDADSLVEQLMVDIRSWERDALTELTCADAEPNVERSIREISFIHSVELTGTKKISDAEVTAEFRVRVVDVMRSIEVLVINTDGYWCWQDMTLLPEPGFPPP